MSNITHQRLYPQKISLTQYPAFSDRLKIAMDIRDYTTKKLANKIYTSPTTVTMYRCGRRMPSTDILCLIAKELDVTTDFLLGMNDYIYV